MFTCRVEQCAWQCGTEKDLNAHYQKYHPDVKLASSKSFQRIEKEKKCFKCGATKNLITQGNDWICSPCVKKDL